MPAVASAAKPDLRKPASRSLPAQFVTGRARNVTSASGLAARIGRKVNNTRRACQGKETAAARVVAICAVLRAVGVVLDILLSFWALPVVARGPFRLACLPVYTYVL